MEDLLGRMRLSRSLLNYTEPEDDCTCPVPRCSKADYYLAPFADDFFFCARVRMHDGVR
jgi:hypothetical protein